VICLDTNILIAAINARPAGIRARLSTEIASGVPIGVSAIVLFEMRYGAAKSDRRARSEAALDSFMSLGMVTLPFDAEDAAQAGDIRAHLERQGQPIGYYDYLIAAQARRRGAPLVTFNRNEFERVPGLTVLQWAA
jgi:tRNA(fMet)-specific endonuclease VapC